jgi:hypothetical protein
VIISPDFTPRFTGEVVIVFPLLNLLDPETFPVTVPSAFWTKLLMVGMFSLAASSTDLFWLDIMRIVPKLSPTGCFLSDLDEACSDTEPPKKENGSYFGFGATVFSTFFAATSFFVPEEEAIVRLRTELLAWTSKSNKQIMLILRHVSASIG